MSEAVSVTEVRQSAGDLSWSDSLALVQAVAAVASAHGWPGVLSAFRLTSIGTVEVAEAARTDGEASLAISTLAGFLEQLLPPPAAVVEPRVPAGLRYALVRARGGVTAPPFQSLDEFSRAIARFEQGDRAALLAQVGKRLTQPPRRPASAARQATAPAREAASPLLDAAAPAAASPPAPSVRTTPTSGWEELPLATHLEPSAAATSVDARSGRRAGLLLTAAAVVSVLLAALVVASALVVSIDSVRAPSRAAGSTDGGSRAAQPPAQELPTTPPLAQADAGSPAGQQAPPEAIGTSAASEDASSGNAARDDTNVPRPESARPGEMVEAMDVGNEPVFSPSFAADGSAIFFDENDGAGGSPLKEARTAGSGRVVQVLSVVADGARNYHPRLSPDGSQVAFDSDRDGVRGVYVSDRAGQNIRRVSGAGYAAVPTWSPDGSRLAFVKAEPDNPRVWNIWMLTVATGEATRITSYRVGQPWGASWLPDGRRICYSHEDRLVVLDLDSGESQTYTSPRKGALLRTPAVSPDGRQAIFQLHGDGVWMLDLGDGKMRKVLDDPTAEEFAWSPDGTRVAFHSRRDRQWGIWLLSR